MARVSKEKDSTYNKAYYERLKADPERMAERTRKSVARRVQKNKLDRVARWEDIVTLIEAASKRGASCQRIAEELAEEFNVVKVKKGKTEQWIDFSPLQEKSLSSSSSATARPARTQEGANA